LSYGEVASLLYANFGVLMIGIEKATTTARGTEGGREEGGSEGGSRVELEMFPPPGYVVGSTGWAQHAYLIAPSKEICDLILEWEPREGIPAGSPLSKRPNKSRPATPLTRSTAQVYPAETALPAEPVQRGQVDEELDEIRNVLLRSTKKGGDSHILFKKGPKMTQTGTQRAVSNVSVGQGGPASPGVGGLLGGGAVLGGGSSVQSAAPIQPPCPSMGSIDSLMQGIPGAAGPRAWQEYSPVKHRDHILICGPLRGVEMLVSSLRQDPVRHRQVIVILQALMSDYYHIWTYNCVCFFDCCCPACFTSSSLNRTDPRTRPPCP